MVTAHARQVLIACKMAHVFAALDRIVAQHHFSADAQLRIVLQLLEVETEYNWPEPGCTLH